MVLGVASCSATGTRSYEDRELSFISPTISYQPMESAAEVCPSPLIGRSKTASHGAKRNSLTGHWPWFNHLKHAANSWTSQSWWKCFFQASTRIKPCSNYFQLVFTFRFIYFFRPQRLVWKLACIFSDVFPLDLPPKSSYRFMWIVLVTHDTSTSFLLRDVESTKFRSTLCA